MKNTLLITALIVIIYLVIILRKHKMDYAALDAKITEMETAVAGAFQRAAAALTGAPSATALTASIAKVQSVIDAANAMAPATPAA